MEDTTDMIQATTKAIEEAKDTLESLTNEMKALSEAITELLMGQIEKIRSHRMAIVRDAQETLSAMREVRKFFLESDYADEMARLQGFVTLCRQLQDLKASGTLDAIVDVAIRLAVREGDAR